MCLYIKKMHYLCHESNLKKTNCMKNFNAKALFVMLLCAATGKTFAYDLKVGDFYYNLAGTDATVTYLDANNNGNAYAGNLTIPANFTNDGTTYNVVAIGKSAFINCKNLTSITIPNSVTSIGSNAFAWCTGLTSVTIPGNVITIGKYAFSKCTGLTTLTLSEGITDIKAWAFNECLGLTNVTFPATMQNVAEHAFHACNNLTSVNFPSIEALCSINFGWLGNPLFFAHHLQIAGTEVTDVVIPTTITKINDYTFHGGTNLTSITLHNGITEIGDWSFAECYNLTNPTCVIPDNVTVIGDNAFYNTKFRFVTIGKKVEQIGFDVFSFDQVMADSLGVAKPSIAYWLTTTPPVGFTNLDISANYVLSNDLATGSMKSLKGIAVNPNLDKIFEVDGLKYVANEAGDSCDVIGGAPLTGYKLIIPASVNYNGTTLAVRDILSVAFNALTNIGYVELNNTRGIGEQAFLNCTKLRHIFISPNVKNIGVKAFSGCNNVRMLTSTATTPAACANANSITELDAKKCKLVVPVGTSATYKKATGWKALTASVEADVTKIFDDGFIQYILTEAGDSCDVFGADPYGSIVYDFIPENAYYQGTNIPVRNVTPYAFFGQELLTIIGLYNDGVLSNSTFEGCSNLTVTYLGSNIKRIGSKAFSGCTKMLILASNSAVPPTIEKSDAMTNIDKAKKCKLIVPANAIDTYKGTTVWKDYVATLSTDLNKLSTDSTWIYAVNDDNTASIFAANSASVYFDNRSSLMAVPSLTITSANIPATVNDPDFGELPVSSVMPYAFFGCTKLASATINVRDSVEHNAFHNVSALKTLVLGNDIDALGNEAFLGCKFDSIYSAALIPPTCGVNTFKDADKAKCKLQVAAGALDSYKAADTWKDFVKIAQDAEENSDIRGDIDVDAIETAKADGLDIKEVFDTNGRRLSQPRRGINLLRMSDGSIRKVIVK